MECTKESFALQNLQASADAVNSEVTMHGAVSACGGAREAYKESISQCNLVFGGVEGFRF